MNEDTSKIVDYFVSLDVDTEEETGPGTATSVWKTVTQIAADLKMSEADTQAALERGVTERLIKRGDGVHGTIDEYTLDDPDMNQLMTSA